MGNKHPETITVFIGGRERRLKLGIAAFRLADVRHGRKIYANELGEDMNFGVLASLVWIALLPDEPQLTEDQVLSWLAEDDVDEGEILSKTMASFKTLERSLVSFFGGPEDKGAPVPLAPTPATRSSAPVTFQPPAQRAAQSGQHAGKNSLDDDDKGAPARSSST